jgi:hypothetical protein
LLGSLFYTTVNVMKSTDHERKPGRPPVDSEQLNMRLHRVLLDGVDEYIKNTGEPIGRPEAIRRILTDYLKRRGLLR